MRPDTSRTTFDSGGPSRFTTAYGSPSTPLVDYSYETDGTAHYGEAKGSPMKDDLIKQVGDVIESIGSVQVRYDPAEPDRCRLLNEDNPRIPFVVDHLEH